MCTQDMVNPDGQCQKTDCKENKKGWCKCITRWEQHYFGQEEGQEDEFLKNFDTKGRE